MDWRRNRSPESRDCRISLQSSPLIYRNGYWQTMDARSGGRNEAFYLSRWIKDCSLNRSVSMDSNCKHHETETWAAKPERSAILVTYSMRSVIIRTRWKLPPNYILLSSLFWLYVVKAPACFGHVGTSSGTCLIKGKIYDSCLLWQRLNAGNV
jgi:hypothetical protein